MTDQTTMLIADDNALPVDGANFETRKIEVINDDTVRIKPTLGSLLFSLMFVLLGVVLAGLWAVNTFTSLGGPGSVPLLFIGLLFLAAGLASYYSGNEQVVINREAGVAIVRSWHPSVKLDSKLLQAHIQPQQMLAIQTVSRVVKHRSNRSRNRSSYTQYQVNVCTEGNNRQNVFITLKADKASQLSNRLSTLFDVPLQVS